MEQHAKDLMGHVNALAKRGYQESSKSPDYVVLFAPFESILSEALEVDPQILHKSFEKGITIATPTTMMALLRTVAYVFNQSEMAQNASAITDLAGTLLKRIGLVHNKIAALGKSIKTSERAFNDLVQSAEENMLRPARKMLTLGVPATNKLKSNEACNR
jgi:DNA recombination protein RmuC